MHVHFVNENIGGHATMHHHLRRALAENTDIRATFFDLPRDPFVRRLFGAAVPGLGRLDLDLQVVRAGLAQSAIVKRHLGRLAETPDALHAYTQNAALLSVGYMRKVPTVVSTDITNRQNAYRIPHRRPTRFTPLSVAVGEVFERRVFHEARRVVTHSRWAADALVGAGLPASRIEVIPFGISVPPASGERDQQASPTILFVGTSMARKGGWKLIELWRRHLSETSRLVIVTPEAVPPLPHLAARNDIRPGDGKLGAVLASADIYVMPSEMDAFGYSLLEAMAAGLPVVALAQAAVPELVEDGVSGILVPPVDDLALVRALRELIGDPARRRELGAAARQRVVERFDSNVTTASLVSLIRAVVDE